MSKIQLTSVAAFKEYARRPILVKIGNDLEAYVRRVSMNEFFEIQENFKEAQNSSTEASEEVDLGEMRKRMDKQFRAIAKIMTKVVTLESGAPVYTDESIDELLEFITPQFVKDFIKAFMDAQGISEETPAKAESTFPKES